MPIYKRTNAGFTLLELLVVIAMIGVLGGLAFSSFSKIRSQLGLEQSVTKLSQDIQRCRSLALAKGRSCRIDFRSANSYSVDLSAGGGWNQQYRVTIASNVTGSWSAGDTIVFNSRGYASFPAAPSPYVITFSKGNDTYQIVPTMVGAVRVVKQ